LINHPPSRVTMNYFIGKMNSDVIFELSDALFRKRGRVWCQDLSKTGEKKEKPENITYSL
jgi:hypothetical protein